MVGHGGIEPPASALDRDEPLCYGNDCGLVLRDGAGRYTWSPDRDATLPSLPSASTRVADGIAW